MIKWKESESNQSNNEKINLIKKEKIIEEKKM